MNELNLLYVLAAIIAISLTQLEWLSEAVPLQPQLHPGAQHIQDLRKQSDLHAASSHQSANLWHRNIGLAHTPKPKVKVNVHPALTTKFMAFVAQAIKREGEDDGDTPASETAATAEGEDAAAGVDDVTGGGGGGNDTTSAGEGGGSGEGGSGNGTSADGGGGGNGTTSGSTTNGGEITIALPKFHTDAMGNRVYHKWGATYGNIWVDTRFKGAGFTIPRIRVDSNASINYYPDGPRSTVCMGSTVYNVPRVLTWLKRNVYTEVHKHRPFWDPLRQQIYKRGNSEECHDVKYSKFRDYQECAMRRNQRMEYFVPKYPLHQIGYRKKQTKAP
ncbi:hypothetical protein KR093_001816 [Drosophila rubida]|uniref:Uncharacterized protein n=1 Tax=Drosophila rubida TaxID=30044 RepID=A0AAD4K4E0_9MUSC|nr:hypothetical protein KR093_001816 [Drosophila rubida]